MGAFSITGVAETEEIEYNDVVVFALVFAQLTGNSAAHLNATGCLSVTESRSTYTIIFSGALAQLARAPALQAGGPGFESPTLHQNQYPTFK